MAGKKIDPNRTSKVCSGPCKRRLKLKNADGTGNFPADRSQPDGFRTKCKDCYNDRQQERREARPEVERDHYLKYKRGVTAKADARDEKALAEAEREARKIAKQREKAEIDRLKLEQRTRERQQRLDSDFSNLRPDDFSSDEDFDTGVANDPKSRMLSHQASAEKRQEFSKAMGEHVRNVRNAVVAEERTGQNMVDLMPADGGAYIGKLAEQERRFGNRRLARSLSLFSAGEELARRLFMQAASQYLTGRVVPTGYAKRPNTKPLKRSVCLLLSDLHLGADLVAAENPMPYRKVEEARRLEYVMRQAIDYKPQYRSDSKLRLLLNGDMIEGLLLHDYRDGAPLTEQKVVFQIHFERMMGEFARAFPEVEVDCQPGNHGRDKLRHPGRATSAKWDGHEWQMYYALARSCSSLKNVKFNLPFRAISDVNLHGAHLLMTHADTEVKIGDPDTKAKQNAQVLAEINSTRIYGVEFAVAAFGHYHTPRYQPRQVKQIFNGALIPPNGHARSNAWIGETCGQYLWEAVEGYPVGDLRFIEVGRSQDHDERLGTILKPFRFDLE